MMNRKLLYLLFWLIFGVYTATFAQEPAQPAQPQDSGNQQQVQVIDIEAQILDARVELPQVQILDKRKKSNFDEVNVEKSFSSELSGKTEKLEFTPNTSGKIRPIKNVDGLLNKKRF
jgi:hypothetical protein